MREEITTIVFDLDGTIYQDVAFHRDYLRFLVEGTDKADWADALINLSDAALGGRRLRMNAFYACERIHAAVPDEYAMLLERALLPFLTYEEAIARQDVVYTGDAWALVTLIGRTLGLLDGDRSDLIYRRTREKMSRDGVRGSAKLKDAILQLNGCFDTILLSNSYESTAQDFLRQLGYQDTFRQTVFAANKPVGMVQALKHLDEKLLQHPERVLSVGDHAFNDLMPLGRLGCRTLWVNPFPGIHSPECDASVRTPEELADYFEALCCQRQQRRSVVYTH